MKTPARNAGPAAGRASARPQTLCSRKGGLKPALLLRLALFAPSAATVHAAAPALKFDFGPGAVAPGFTAVASSTLYTRERGYGFEPGAALRDVDRATADPLRGDHVTTSDPLFKFSVAVPEGNYRVTVTLGDAAGESLTTIRAETRRLVAERVRTAPGEFAVRTFIVNVRTPQLSPGNAMKLDVREMDPKTGQPVTATWDDKLTLQFGDTRPCVCAVEIEPVPDVPTVFLLGDSTVTDQASDPSGTWGQTLPRWFGPTIAIANHAESGETLKGIRVRHRWAKVMGLMRAGDYVFLQFGHNDLNKSGHDAMWPREDLSGDWINTHSDANTDYKWLLAAYATEVKRRGGTPVIVSPMTKLNIRTGQLNVAGLGDYPAAARDAAQLAGCAFIDLNAMSVQVMTALGEPRAPKAYTDGLHSNTYGGYIFSRCVVEGIRRAVPELARHLAADAGSFDPAHPSPLPDDFTLPVEPRVALPVPPGFPPRASGSTPAPAKK